MYERIVRRCEELGYSPSGFCVSIGLRKAYLTELKTGKIRSFSAEKVAQIAKGLRVSCDYLINGEEFNDSLSATERQLLNAWRRASRSERENVAFILRNYGVSATLETKDEVAV